MENSNFFKISNEYQDAKCRIRIPGQAGQVLNVIERLTFGWKKSEANIPYKTFRKMTGLNDWGIWRAKNKLIKMNIISPPKTDPLKKAGEKDISYRIQMDYTRWNLPAKIRELKKAGKPPLKKAGKPPLKKAGGQQGHIKDIIKDKYKYSKSNEIKQLKIRKKELQIELKEKGQFDNKKFLIKGIKEIEKQLKKLK